ncbi:PDZ domain-containing protein [uncultured Thiohalocapsa sp.]|uniref:M61 family metallopeptidase n=1 Tax=uncultured Thiohalocapsa sp. TaxID=768990 RepID=UPI0025E8D1DF|nr:PDZ domain-containing protein [uncultured Thiohalocapsa sp.]
MPDHALIRYRVTPARPAAHLFAIELHIPDAGGDPAPLTLSLPAWIPGSYMIRDFARNIVRIGAERGGAPVTLEKLDKQTWRAPAGGGTLRVRYEVYAWELTVRSAHLDRTHGYFNGPSLFLRVHGRDHEPCRVELLAPPDAACGDWSVATSLMRDGAERWAFGAYRARDYADLIDHPVEMGRFDVIAFKVRDVPHWMAVSGRHRADLTRIAADLAPICEEHVALFGELPADRYLFLTQVVGDGYGGLEHKFSSSLLCSRDDLPAQPGTTAPGTDAGHAGGDYRKFLGLCSHEYFHLWNVKRIRPAAFVAGGLEREVHTRLLWAFEGITSYYDDLALARSGRIDTEGYLALLAETITKVMRNPGRLHQSIAESSFDAWTKFYKQDENAPNAIVSYYGKGALTALALDLTIRRDTAGRRSLDDVMRALWERYGERRDHPGAGVPERAIEALAAEVTGLDLSAFFEQALDGTADLDLPGLLATVGVEMRLRPGKGPKDFGNVTAALTPVEPVSDVGLRLAPGVEAKVAVVLDERPAQRAGLAAGDVIIAVDGLKVDGHNAGKRLRALPMGQPVSVHAFRRDELMTFELAPAAAPADVCELRVDDQASAAVLAQRRAWLASVAGV